ncbi:helix-turn-helix domain-containing protein [Paraflavitalea pollutisoli]|uniref:helix-turn-helix domain-containing protein n=1 Tax=Paraflavitalea pollutisoli TaxID=3034143 RepID=UPI0023EC08BC|nr:helix-turn-helix domain-containing protein [Paraflavitalea sp. H1-2-19X]
MAFGKEIKRLRDSINLSAQKLADLIGIDAERLRKWEQKDLNPREEDVARIEQFFGITLEEVMQLEHLRAARLIPRTNTDNLQQAVARITEAREAKGMTQTDVAEQLATSLGQTYSLRQYQKMEAGEFPKFKKEIVRQLEQVLNVSLYELIYEPIQKPSEAFESLFDGTVNHLAQRRKLKTEEDTSHDGIIYVPIAAQAGYAKSVGSQLYLHQLQQFVLPGFPYRGEQYRVFEVKGDSMEPVFKEGYHLICERIEQDAWRQIAEFYAYIIVLEQDIILKRLAFKNDDNYVAISDNEFYKQFLLPMKDIKELWLVKRKMDWEMAPGKKYKIEI